MISAPYLGARGGPCIDGEYVYQKEERKKHNDVIWASYWTDTFTEIPYRALLPKKLENLIAVGRSASSIPDTALRHRPTAMHLGTVGGAAAFLAVEKGKSPKQLDIRELQQTLLGSGFIFAKK